MSPNFPDGYPSNTECIWIIDAGYGKTVNITFHLVEFENTGYCSYDYIEVYNLQFINNPILYVYLCRFTMAQTIRIPF